MRGQPNATATKVRAVKGRTRSEAPRKRAATQPTGRRRTSKALARIEAAPAVGGRSSAAKKAYERRQQRAVAVLGDDAGTGVLPKRITVLRARIPFVASIIALLSCGLALTLLLTTRAAEESYQLSAARAENQRMEQERAALERDVQAADSAPELAARARELGMIPARDPARLIVAPDGAVTVVGTPAPAEGAAAPLLNPVTQTLNRSGGSEIPVQRTSSSQQTSTRATPQPSNGQQVQAQGEQLVPMTLPSEPR